MKTHYQRIASFTAILSLLLMPLLSACGQATETAPAAPPTEHPALATVAALQAENSMLVAQLTQLAQEAAQPPQATEVPPPQDTATPTIQPTPGPTITVPEGLETVSHASAPGYTFAYDPDLWRVGDAVDPTKDFLLNRLAAQCKINLGTAPAEENLLTYYPRAVGRRGWLVRQDADNTFYTHQDLTVQLLYNENADCLAAQEALLANLFSVQELSGAPAATAIATPTQLPTPEGFVCDGALPPRLQKGDRALMVTPFLWLRSEAKVAEETEVKLYTQNGAAEITITGDPICLDKAIFYPVAVRAFGPLGQTITGFMAESGNQVYYLEPWYLGW